MITIKAIVISALTIPVLIFAIFFGIGIVFMVSTFLQSGEYNKGWLGMVYAGLIYGYFAILLSSIPTITLGLPASFLAQKYNLLNRPVILLGAATIGGLFLSIAGVFIFQSYSIKVFAWIFFAGGAGGLINGVVYFRQIKPDNGIKPAPSGLGSR